MTLEDSAPASVWLSRLLLDPRAWDVPADLGNPNAMHRRLCSLFPTDPIDWFAEAPGTSASLASGARRTKSRAEVSLLWRLETPPHPAPPYILLQSTEAPRWDALPAGYAQATDAKPIALPAIEGAAFRFRLRANPTYQPSQLVTQGGRRPRVGVAREPEALLAWLHRRAIGWGFAVLGADVQPEPMIRFRRRPDEDHLTFVACRFDGLLRVTDPRSFRTACAEGCGRGKPYGFGLLSLGRP
jgi:CRISPR system Cascade subunit CasE